MTARNIDPFWPPLPLIDCLTTNIETHIGQMPMKLTHNNMQLVPFVSGQECLVVVDVSRLIRVADVDYNGPICEHVMPTLLYDPIAERDPVFNPDPWDEVWTPANWTDKTTDWLERQSWLAVLLRTGQTKRQVEEIFHNGWWEVYTKEAQTGST